MIIDFNPYLFLYLYPGRTTEIPNGNDTSIKISETWYYRRHPAETSESPPKSFNPDSAEKSRATEEMLTFIRYRGDSNTFKSE